MVYTIILFIIGLILIIKGGDVFVDAATWIAEKSGIPKFIVGATIVSMATTIPEMIASVIGTIDGSLGLAVGNAVGSVTANMGLIMAISIIFMPGLINRKQYAFKTILLLVITLVLGLFLINGSLNLLESILILILTIIFFVENVISAKSMNTLTDEVKDLESKDENSKAEEVKEPEEDNKLALKDYIIKTIATILSFVGIILVLTLTTKIAIYEAIILLILVGSYFWVDVLEEKVNLVGKALKAFDIILNIFKFLIGAAGIYYGAKYLVSEGTLIAQGIGVSDAIIGLTLVAIGTSLPELVTTITAIAKKQSSLSVGNIVGANIIDMSVILPVCAFVGGGKLVLESMQTVYLDIPVSLAIMLIAFIPMLITKKFSRWQGIVMLLIYIAYLVVICTGLITF